MADWKDIGKNVAAIAPMIGGALGGPVGSVVGLGVKAVCGLFGIEPDAEDAPDQAEKALNAMTPEQAIQLKEADRTFKLQMKKLGVDIKKIAMQDRKSARSMQIATRSKIPGVLAILVTLGFFGLLAFMLFYTVPTDNMPVLNIMLGSLGTAWITVMTFYFGSSDGSQIKTTALASAAAEINKG